MLRSRDSLLLIAALVIVSPTPARTQTYNFQIGYTQCYACGAGTYVGAEGSGQCLACEKGYYQDANGSSACAECPEGILFVLLCTSLFRSLHIKMQVFFSTYLCH